MKFKIPIFTSQVTLWFIKEWSEMKNVWLEMLLNEIQTHFIFLYNNVTCIKDVSIWMSYLY